MKSGRPYARAYITPKGERSCRAGHPWVYADEIERVLAPGEDDSLLPVKERDPFAGLEERGVSNGSLVDVVTRKGGYLGTGILSLSSKIRIRILSTNANDAFDRAFWERKIRWSWEHRKAVLGDDASCCRIVFSESDGLCGLIVDRYEDVLVTQTLAYGTERLKPIVIPILVDVLERDGIAIRGVYERNDVKTRDLEGLSQSCGWYPFDQAPSPASCPARIPAIEDVPSPIAPESEAAGRYGPTKARIVENGVRFEVDFERGQKTGFFLDQKYNRRAVGALSRGRRVLDCFTHTGSFALNASVGGADHVHAVDISELAIEAAKANAKLNGPEVERRMSYQVADVFELLPSLGHDRAARYDFIVLDPPALTKSRRTVDSASRGYYEINKQAMKLLPRGGYLATCSCSHFMDESRFRKMLSSAAHDANVQLKQVEERQQAPDHPILWGVPETDYLKFFLFQVV